MSSSPLVFTAILATITCLPADVPSWRNGGNGKYPDAKPALEWDGKDLWSTPLPARSNASPIVVGERIFVTAEPATLLCLDRATGRILWQKDNAYEEVLEISPEVKTALEEAKERAAKVADEVEPLKRDLYRAQRRARRDNSPELRREIEGLEQQIRSLEGEPVPAAAQFQVPPTHDTNGYSSYTPVSDGARVFTAFGTGVVAAYDLEGKRLWAARLDNPDHNWGGACSPILAGDTLVVRFADWVGLDPATGKERWRVPSEITFNCPAVFEVEGTPYLYTNRGQLIRAKDGKLLPSQNFTQTAKPWAFFNTPSVVEGHIYTAHGSEGEAGKAHAYHIPSTIAELEKSGLKEVWSQTINQNRYYSSPVVHEGIIYLISRDYALQALDVKTGKIHYEQRLRGMTGTAYPSLTLAGDVLFAGAEDGNAVFFKPGPEFVELSRTKAEPFRSTPVFIGDMCYLRTQEELRAIQSK